MESMIQKLKASHSASTKLFYDRSNFEELAVTLREVQGGGHEVVLASDVYFRDLKNSLAVWIIPSTDCHS